MASKRWLWHFDRVIPSEPGAMCDAIHAVVDQLRECGWQECDVFGVHLALEEALANAIKHGNNNDPDKQVRFLCKLGVEAFWAEVRDEGIGFDPQTVPDPTCDECLELPGGRGLLLMRRYMNRVAFNARGNRVVMEKTRSAS